MSTHWNPLNWCLARYRYICAVLGLLTILVVAHQVPVQRTKARVMQRILYGARALERVAPGCSEHPEVLRQLDILQREADEVGADYEGSVLPAVERYYRDPGNYEESRRLSRGQFASPEAMMEYGALTDDPELITAGSLLIEDRAP